MPQYIGQMDRHRFEFCNVFENNIDFRIFVGFFQSPEKSSSGGPMNGQVNVNIIFMSPVKQVVEIYASVAAVHFISRVLTSVQLQQRTP